MAWNVVVVASSRKGQRHNQGDLAGDRGGFSLPNLKFLVVEDELFNGGIGVESGCCGTVEEGDKDTEFF